MIKKIVLNQFACCINNEIKFLSISFKENVFRQWRPQRQLGQLKNETFGKNLSFNNSLPFLWCDVTVERDTCLLVLCSPVTNSASFVENFKKTEKFSIFSQELEQATIHVGGKFASFKLFFKKIFKFSNRLGTGDHTLSR